MLTQTYRREVPGSAAFVERTLLRDPHFCVAIVRARGLAVDMGVVTRAVRHLARFSRPQLTLVLAGRTYFDLRGRVLTLGPGDVVVTDPAQHAGEGYGGDEAEVVTIEADEQGIFTLPAASGSVSRLSSRDVAVLRALVAERPALTPERFVARLAQQLRALGLPLVRDVMPGLAPSSAPLVRLYAALGEALSRLDTQPSLAEIATSSGTSERHANRLLHDLARDYRHPFASWRELVHEMRLVWATQLLSVPAMPLDRVARLAGYRSSIALHHALSIRGAATPRTIARRLAERWHD